MTNLEKYKDEILKEYGSASTLACAIAKCRGITKYVCNTSCRECISQSFNWFLEEASITDWTKVKQGATVCLVKNDEKVGYFVAQYRDNVVCDVEDFDDTYVYDSWNVNGVYAEESE